MYVHHIHSFVHEAYINSYKVLSWGFSQFYTIGCLFWGLRISWKEQKYFFHGDYFRGLTFSARATTYMIMINSYIYVIFRWNNFRLKQKNCKICENCGPRKKAPYGIHKVDKNAFGSSKKTLTLKLWKIHHFVLSRMSQKFVPMNKRAETIMMSEYMGWLYAVMSRWRTVQHIMNTIILP